MLAGEPFSDQPRAVSPAIGSFLRSYNDAIDDRRRQDLRECAEKIIGSNGSVEVELARAMRLASWAAALQTPWWARLLPTHLRRAVARSRELPIFAVEVVGTRVTGAITRHTDRTHAARACDGRRAARDGPDRCANAAVAFVRGHRLI